MLVICEVCDNNVVDELSARKGETVCKLCQEEAKRKAKEEAKKNRTKICKICGFEGHHSKFKKDTRTCKKCYAEKVKKQRHAALERDIKKSETYSQDQWAKKEYNHLYYLTHKRESLERTRRNRAKKKECT